ncbi:DUF4279 domain-containing protein [Steroidobacter cummioxidans]|uniref:DUF4279 domain-containing protein n=1 Tax=Steroidobacter cummioxidans TaxID=1803913 RepID=UPI000E31C27D|nr:DUF4279 domain-containing protein [Steroidobacter cummioxidans]
MSGIGTVLRLSGSKRSVETFLAGTKWTPLSVYWKGRKRFESSRSVSKVSGLNVNISDATGLQLSKQVKDALRILRRDAVELHRLKELKLHAVLDFGVEVKDKDGPAFFRFPSELLQSLAQCGISLEVSYYGSQP